MPNDSPESRSVGGASVPRVCEQQAYDEAVKSHPWILTPPSISKEEQLEAMFESYPLRPASEDPRWAVRTVWIWVGMAIFSIAFILVLLVLGFIYGGS